MIHYSYFKNVNSKITILLLHGWGVTSSYMESLKDYLLKDYSVLLVDLPGHGKSILERPYTVNDYIDELFLIVNKEKIDKLYGIGHSFGGKLLSYYCLKYKIDGVIVIAPSTIKPRFSLFKFMKIRLFKIFRKLRLPMPSFLQGSRDFKKTSGIKRETFLNVCNSYLDKKELRKIKIPYLIIGFKDDKEVRLYQVEKLKKYVPGSKLFIYNGNHFSYFDYYFEIKKLILLLNRRQL